MKALPVVLIAVSLSGCAWIGQNQAATAEYARQVTIASERAALLEAQLAAAEQKIATLEETVQLHGQNESRRVETIDEVNSELARLRGQIEEMQFHVQEMQKFLDTDAVDRERRMLYAERRLTELEKYLRVKAPPPPTDQDLGIARGDGAPPPVDPTVGDGSTATPPVEPTVPEVAPPKTADEAIELAVTHMKADRQGVARVVLQKALEDFPDAPEKPEILYRIGETYLNEKDWKAAIKAFDPVVKGYAKSDWAPWAMLRQGEAFEGLGRPDNAKVFYQSVVDTYPKSAAAKEAKSRLD